MSLIHPTSQLWEAPKCICKNEVLWQLDTDITKDQDESFIYSHGHYTSHNTSILYKQYWPITHIYTCSHLFALQIYSCRRNPVTSTTPKKMAWIFSQCIVFRKVLLSNSYLHIDFTHFDTTE